MQLWIINLPYMVVISQNVQTSKHYVVHPNIMLCISFVLKSLKNQTIKQAIMFNVNIESNLYLKTEIIYKLFIQIHEI